MSSYTVLSFEGAALPAAYRPLIFSKWLRSLRYGNDYVRMIDQGAYFTAQHARIEDILAHAQIRLAVLSDEHDVVLGFAVARGTVLDYAHVHKDARRQGIARALVPGSIDTVSAMTHTGMVIWANKYPHWKFNPYA